VKAASAVDEKSTVRMTVLFVLCSLRGIVAVARPADEAQRSKFIGDSSRNEFWEPQ